MRQPQTAGLTVASDRSPPPPPVSNGSPADGLRQRHQRLQIPRRDRTHSVVSAAAAALPADDHHKISNNEALVHMVKATIGGGFLAMPDAFHNVGLLIGVLGTLIIGLIVLNTMTTIVRCSQVLRSKYGFTGDNKKGAASKRENTTKTAIDHPLDYPETVAGVFLHGARGRFSWLAPFAKSFTGFILVATYYGVNIIYVCIVAGTTKQLVDLYTKYADHTTFPGSLNGLSIRWYPVLIAVLIVPLGMIRLIKYLVPFSVAANASLTLGAAMVFYYLFTGTAAGTNGEAKAPQLIVWSVSRWSLFIGSTLCSMEGVGMLLHIENAMREPTALIQAPSYTLRRAMAIIVVLNGSLGLFGYLKYGNACAGSISLNLPSGSWVSDAVKIVIALGILLTYGLQLTVTTDLTWRWMRSKLVRRALLEKTKKMKIHWRVDGTVVTGLGDLNENRTDGVAVFGDQENGKRIDSDENQLQPIESTTEGSETSDDTRLTLFYYAMRLTLITGTILIASIVPDIGPLISLVGSVGFSVLGLAVPVFMETVWHWYPDNEESYGPNANETTVEEGRCENSDDASSAKAVVDGQMSRGLRIRRFARHSKNLMLIALSIYATVGGAYFNVRDIIDRASNDGSAPPSI